MKEEEAIQMLADPQKRRKAFEWMVGQYSQQLYWKIRRIVLTHDDADDVLQNTFIKAWTHLDDFRQKSKLSTWLYRIAVNEALDFLRRQKTMAGIMTDVQMPVDDGGEHSPSVFDRLMADEYFDGDRAQALLQESIALLPDVQRTVFTLRYFEEMPYTEMSAILHTSEGALKASYHLAVKKVTEYIKKRED